MGSMAARRIDTRVSLGFLTVAIPRFKGFWQRPVAFVRRHGCAQGLALSLSEREEISRGVVAGRSMRSIAASMRRAPSTVSREIRPQWRSAEATERAKRMQAAWERARRPKRCKLAQNRVLARIVAQKLRLLWSP